MKRSLNILGGVAMVAIAFTVAVGMAAAAHGATIAMSATGHQGCANSITDGNITWTLAKYYPARQCWTGDWIVTPRGDDPNAPIVSSVSPETVYDPNDPNTIRNGSMVNPVPSVYQCYDGRATFQDANLLPTFPLTLDPNGTSLVSTVSRAEDADFVAATGHRGYVSEASILTCLAEMPTDVGNCLRPAYCGTTKTVYNVASLDANSLPARASVSGTPTLAHYESAYAIDGDPDHGYVNFKRPWLDHVIDFTNQEIHPFTHMDDYGRDISREVGDALLMLCLNDVGDRTPLARAICQQGVDFYGIAQAGGYWPENGGHNMARASLIVAAGSMLNDPNMVGIVAAGETRFQEVEQAFYISQTDVDRTLDCEVSITVTAADANSITGNVQSDLDGYSLVAHGTCEVTAGTGAGQRRAIVSSTQSYPTTISTGNAITLVVTPAWTTALDPNDSVVTILGYETADIGTAEWGIAHVDDPTRDNPAFGSAYRLSNGYCWVGWATAMELMGLDDDWSAPDVFDYVVRHMAVTDTGGAWPDPSNRSLSAFAGEMYDTYHGN